MGIIETRYDPDRHLTLFKAVGEMTANDFFDCLQRYYETGVTPSALWDLSEAKLSSLTSDEIGNLAQYGSQLAATREEGKTAIVFDSPFDYGLGRIFQTYAEMKASPVEVRLFRSLDEANAWFSLSRAPSHSTSALNEHLLRAGAAQLAPMGNVQMTIDLSGDLTVVKTVGRVTADDLRFWVRDYYSGNVTSRVLWDLANIDLSEIEPTMTPECTCAHVRQLNEAAAPVRNGGKTAYVVGDNIPALRLFRKIASYAAEADSPVERKTFTDMQEAMKWLGI